MNRSTESEGGVMATLRPKGGTKLPENHDGVGHAQNKGRCHVHSEAGRWRDIQGGARRRSDIRGRAVSKVEQHVSKLSREAEQCLKWHRVASQHPRSGFCCC